MIAHLRKAMPNYYHDPASVDEYIRLAQDHDGAQLIAQLKKHLAPGSSVLELGSGPGTDWALLDQHYEVTGSDLSPEFIKRLHATYPQGSFLQVDAVELDTNLRFDAIYSNKVLHHLSDEELKQSIARQRQVLNLGGLVCHSFWLGEGEETFKGLYVNYHSREELQALFAPDFELLHVQEYAEFEAGDSLVVVARLIAI